MPRNYERRSRLAATAETRAKVVAAACTLLRDAEGAAAFTIDAVAQRADVARMTVYYQFKSKQGLLEAVFDDLASRGEMNRLREVFTIPDALAALDAFIERFTRFWSGDRLLLRRLYALAALDPEIEASLGERIGWRREGLETVVSRLKPHAGAEALDTLQMLTSFEAYDLLAAQGRRSAAVAAIVQRLARAALDAQPTPTRGRHR